MLPEYHVVLDVDDIHDIISVMLPQVLEDLQLHASLIVVFLFVLDYLDGKLLLRLVIYALECRSKRALSKELKDLIPVANMVSCNDLIVSLVIIKTMVLVKHLLILILAVVILRFF